MHPFTVKIFFASQRILSLVFSFKDFFIIIQYLVRYINFHLKCATFFCYAERNLNLKLKSGEGFGVSQLTRKTIKQSPESSGDVRLLNLWPYSFWDLISLKHKWKWLLLGVCVCVFIFFHRGGFFRLKNVQDILEGTDQRSCVVNISWVLSAKFHHLRIWKCHISPPKTKTPADSLLERKRYDIMCSTKRWYKSVLA